MFKARIMITGVFLMFHLAVMPTFTTLDKFLQRVTIWCHLLPIN